jgi:hypothetical protein
MSKVLKIVLGIIALIICIVLAIFTEGLVLPIVVPVAFWALQQMGIKVE